MGHLGFGRGGPAQDARKDTFVALLRACAKTKDLCRGTKLHDDITKKGLLHECLDALVTMYARCGVLDKAQELFDLHESRDVYTWTALIAAYTQKGQGHNALTCFEQMQEHGLSPNAVTFNCILKACGSTGAIDKGQKLHDEMAKLGFLDDNILLGNALVDMYAKCGALSKARCVLKELPNQNVISWTALIAGYAQHGEGEQALKCLEEMQQEGLTPNVVTFICILKACGSIRAADKGEQIHDEIAKQGLLGANVVLGNALIDMYAKCGALSKALVVLENLPNRNAISWNTLIAGYIQEGDCHQALNCFERMQRDGLCPDVVTYTCILKACGSIGALDKGEKIHDEIAEQGLLENNPGLGNAVVVMYAKCGALPKARQVLEELPVRNAISWSALITGYAEQSEGEEALNCFEQMQCEGLSPDTVAFICILKACNSIGSAEKGEKIHDKIAKQGLLETDIVLGNALVDMYAKCGNLAQARQVLQDLPCRDVVSWNALITGYVQQGDSEQALECYEGMQREGLHPNEITFTCILKACGSSAAADKGERVHDEIVEQRLLDNSIVLGNALIDMYVKCGALVKAREVLEELPSRNVISWNALITGYTQQGDGEQALDCLEKMKRGGISPDAVTYTCILKACGTIGATDKGEKILDELSEQGLLGKDIVLTTALVTMYANCGALAKAQQVLENFPIRDVVCWNALITGYVQQCESAKALKCFHKMQREGVAPDAATFSSVLSACSRLSLVEDARLLFMNMTKYGIKPDLEHYTCLIDLFGRSGHLHKAVGVIEKMPSCNSGVWSAILVACQKWGDVKVGRWAFEHGIQENELDAAAYTIMADMYSAAGMLEDAQNIEAIRQKNRARKMWSFDVPGKVPSGILGHRKDTESHHRCAEEGGIGYGMSKLLHSFELVHQ